MGKRECRVCVYVVKVLLTARQCWQDIADESIRMLAGDSGRGKQLGLNCIGQQEILQPVQGDDWRRLPHERSAGGRSACDHAGVLWCLKWRFVLICVS